MEAYPAQFSVDGDYDEYEFDEPDEDGVKDDEEEDSEEENDDAKDEDWSEHMEVTRVCQNVCFLPCSLCFHYF